MKIVSGFICFFAHSSAKHPLFTEADGCVMDIVKVVLCA